MTTSVSFFQLQQQAEQMGLLWFQGAGGNISYKEKNQLWVKPTGYRIGQIKTNEDLSGVDLSAFLKAFPRLKTTPQDQRETAYKNLISSSSLTPSRRPSMETGFHAVLPRTFVFHIHSLRAILLTDQVWKNRTEFLKWYQNQWESRLGKLDFIPALLPGLELAEEIQNKKADLLFLQNHGSIFQFDRPEQLKDFILFEQSLSEKFLNLSFPDFRELSKFEKGPIKSYYPDFAILWPRLSLHLQTEPSGVYTFINATEDRDAYEVWLSTQYLYRNNPELTEFPRHLSEQIVHLPTEIERQKQMGKGS